MSSNKDAPKRINQVYSGIFFTQVSFLIIKSIFILCLAKYFTFSVLQMSNIFHLSEFFGSIISFLVVLASLRSGHKKIIAVVICCILPACYFAMHQNFENFQIITAVGSFVLIMSLANVVNHISRMVMENACNDIITKSNTVSLPFVKNNVGMFFVYATTLMTFPFFFRQSDSLHEITSFCISTSLLSLVSFLVIPSKDFAYIENRFSRTPFINASITVRIIYATLVFLFTAPLIAIIRQGWTLWYYQSFHLLRNIGPYKIFPEQMFGLNLLFIAILHPIVSKVTKMYKITNIVQLAVSSFLVLIGAFLISEIQRRLVLSEGHVSIISHILPRFFVALGELLLASSVISIICDLTGFDLDTSGLIVSVQVVLACLANVLLINITKSKLGAWADLSLVISIVCTVGVLIVCTMIHKLKKSLSLPGYDFDDIASIEDDGKIA